MNKISDKIVKRGDYYQFEAMEDVVPLKPKKDESLLAGQTSEYIVDELPAFNSARSQYYFKKSNINDNKTAEELKDALQAILKEKGIKDQEKEEIAKMLQQIWVLRETNVMPLNKLPRNVLAKQVVDIKQKTITVMADLSLEELEQKLSRLEQYSYPQLTRMEHQLEMLLGEKKCTGSLPILSMNERTKEEIDALYNHLSSLNCVNDLQGMVNNLAMNDCKYAEMACWADNIVSITELNTDFLAELDQDNKLIDRLEHSFVANMVTVRSTIAKTKLSGKQTE